jgi:hypothetical protein
MFCKNARTKIAMATSNEPKAAPLGGNMDSEVQQHSQKVSSPADPAQMFLLGQQMDPSMQLLLEQQLSLCKQQMNAKQQQIQMQQQQNPIMGLANNGLGLGNLNHLFQGMGASTNPTLLQQIEAQKQQQARVFELQQLMALNLQRQQNRRKTSNNFRASAA